MRRSSRPSARRKPHPFLRACPARMAAPLPLTGRGDVNTYALFAEHFTRLAGTRGRAGVIVPTGIATDATTAPFFASLVDGKRLASLFDFENRDAIFPSVHRSYKFSLLTQDRTFEAAGFAFFLTDTSQLSESERRFTLSRRPSPASTPTPKPPRLPLPQGRRTNRQNYSRVPVLIDESRVDGR